MYLEKADRDASELVTREEVGEDWGEIKDGMIKLEGVLV